jgi:CSLREA domain-containing protein
MRRRRASSRLRLLLAATVAAAILPSATAQAATIVPNTTSDVVANDGLCSLREAITASRTHAPSGSEPGECPSGTGNDVITLAPGHYLLSIPGAKEDANASGDLDVDSDLTIQGAGASDTTIETDQPDRVLEILPGATATIEGVTITDGHTPSGAPGANVTGEATSIGHEGETAEGGGGILNKGTLTLIDSTISGNTTGEGGSGGSGTGNPGGNGFGGSGGAGGAGAGIDSEGPLTIIESVITDNSTGAGGLAGSGNGSPGGAEGAGGRGLGGDAGYGGAGGGVASTGPLTIIDSTIADNTTGAGGRGGGGFGGHGETGTDPYGGLAGGGFGGDGGAGGGVYANAMTTVTETEISANRTGAGGFGGIGTGGNGGTGTAGVAGGAGGQGGGGFGGEGGSGGGIAGGNSMTGEISRSAIVNNVTGAGGPADVGVGGAGGTGGSGANGGAGGRGEGGFGTNGGFGAGLEVRTGPVTIANTTIASNASGPGSNGADAVGGSGGLGQGGGSNGTGGDAATGYGGEGGGAGGVVVGYGGTTTLTQDTISGNSVGTGGSAGATAVAGSPGGVATLGEAGPTGAGAALFAEYESRVTLADSISTWSSGEGCQGTITDGAHNISFPDTTCPGTVADPKLGPLQSNGGPTVTEAIPADSPAIDAVPASGAGCEPTDQRGVLRPAGPACDSGAFELATPTATTLEASGAGTAFATLAGLARNPDLAEASAYFQYGTSTAYGRQTGEQTIEATAAGAPYSAVLSGLAAHTTYHFRAVVTNATGVSFGADQTFTTAAQPSTGHTTITTRPPSHSLPLLTPQLRSLSIRPSTLVPERGRGLSITRAKTKRGATVTYSDSQTAVSIFTVQRARPGFLVGKTCADKRPRHARGRVRACTRYVAVGKFTHSDAKGTNSFRFTGRVGSRPLAPGRYRLSATPRAGSLTGKTVSIGFSVV